ncbi:hypothetical protein [Alkalicoccobacillus porphyridii]|uniref:Lipoprotein n=1 Tax=Alkalicoccobacillus porphyridii TaxID=2597270 RepID=A0A554A2K4_9BACI|nr:hypothetical protein [Alkalicoccobacillus porphyridii]TSB47920.1 hypothetical protein FN960_05290 [Alkalicoccobacillus porphyridii]
MNVSWKLNIMLVCSIFIVVACSTEETEIKETTSDENPVEEETDIMEEDVTQQEDNLMDLIDYPLGTFEDINQDKAVKVEYSSLQGDMFEDAITHRMFYGHHELLGSIQETASFNYNLQDEEVTWSFINDGNYDGNTVYKDQFFVADYDEEYKYARIAALSTDTGEVEQTYENEEFRRVQQVYASEEHMMFLASHIEGDGTYLVVHDRESGEYLTMLDASASFRFFELENYYIIMDPNQPIIVYEKETLEKAYEMEDTSFVPVSNSQYIYTLDYMEDVLRSYDHEGNAQEELHLDHSTNRHQLFPPVVTEDYVIILDDEGIRWFDSQLQEELHFIPVDEDYKYHYFEGTDEFLVLSLFNNENSVREEDQFAALINIESGEVMNTFPIEEHFLNMVSSSVHTHDGKVYFATSSGGEEGRRDATGITYYVFGEDVHRGFGE